MTSMRFRNPANGYVEEVSHAPLWCLLFGGFYFLARGVWTHAVVGFLLAIFTWGLSWFIYPFCANRIMRTHYLRRGWLEFRELDGDAPTSPSDPAAPVPPGDG